MANLRTLHAPPPPPGHHDVVDDQLPETERQPGDAAKHAEQRERVHHAGTALTLDGLHGLAGVPGDKVGGGDGLGKYDGKFS